MRDVSDKTAKAPAPTATVDPTAPPAEMGPAIPLEEVQVTEPVNCLGTCSLQQTVRRTPGGTEMYRIDYLPKASLVRIYFLGSFQVAQRQSPETLVPMSNIRGFKFRHDEGWYATALQAAADRASGPRPEPSEDGE